MKRDEIIKGIELLTLTTKDYDVLYNLTQNTSANLFTRIMEEVLQGNIIISDFEVIFPTKLKEGIEQTIVKQAEIEEHFKRFITFRNTIADRRTDTFDNLIAVVEGDGYDKTVVNEKLDRIVDFMNTADVDSLSDTIMNGLYDVILSDDTFAENIVLSRTKLLIPLQEKDMFISDYDRNFMMNNNLTEDEMKKMKALAYLVYYKKAGDGNE